MRLTSCWVARMTEPLQMAAKIKKRVRVKEKKICSESSQRVSVFHILVSCIVQRRLWVWSADVRIFCQQISRGNTQLQNSCTVHAHVHKYNDGALLLLYVQSHVCAQSILNEIFLDHHKPLQQLVECALFMSWILDGFWLILIIHRHSDSTWVWYEPPSATQIHPLCLLSSSLCSFLVDLLSVWCISSCRASLWRSAPM